MKIFIAISLLLLMVASLSFSVSKLYVAKSIIEDSLEKDRLKYMNEVLASIKGKEKMRADSVFKNLQVIRGESAISAEHLLWMMNWGWSAELGITCNYCHDVNDWVSDVKPAKNIARGMWNMRVKINNEILPAITNRNYQDSPAVSCITCHRGSPIPTEK